MPHEKEFKLSERDKKRFETKAKQITEHDVVEVMTKFGKKLERLEAWISKTKVVPDFLASFVRNLKLIYELLSDPVFKVSWATKSWLIFALAYFIMPIDLIPDMIPIVGYLDDYTVLGWITNICSDEIERYKSFRKARNRNNSKNIILLQRGSSNRRIIIATGFISKPDTASTFIPWINSIRKIDRSAYIYSFLWDTKSVVDLLSVANDAIKPGQNPFLRIGYSISRIRQVWKDAVMNTSLYANAMVRGLESMRKRSMKNLEITLIGHSLGARLVGNALSMADKGLINNIITIGGAVSVHAPWFHYAKKVNHHINGYSRKDNVLSYLYRIAESGEKPIGLYRIGKRNSKKRFEIDCTEFVKRHSEYSSTGDRWLRITS